MTDSGSEGRGFESHRDHLKHTEASVGQRLTEAFIITNTENYPQGLFLQQRSDVEDGYGADDGGA